MPNDGDHQVPFTFDFSALDLHFKNDQPNATLSITEDDTSFKLCTIISILLLLELFPLPSLLPPPHDPDIFSRDRKSQQKHIKIHSFRPRKCHPRFMSI
jgi:hypothetical protein